MKRITLKWLTFTDGAGYAQNFWAHGFEYVNGLLILLDPDGQTTEWAGVSELKVTHNASYNLGITH